MASSQCPLYYTDMNSPLGTLHLLATKEALKFLFFDEYWKSVGSDFKYIEDKNLPILELAVAELKKYFAGQLSSFSVRLEFDGTVFQKHTWETLTKIPYGKTISYGEQASLMGNPKAVRAVGHTNGKNPIPIIVPCHRVIGKSGKLTGYSGGLYIKEKLLHLERTSAGGSQWSGT